MNVYSVIRNGMYQRQIVAGSLEEARRWVDNYMPGCTVRFELKLVGR
jgi:hypothetical protein